MPCTKPRPRRNIEVRFDSTRSKPLSWGVSFCGDRSVKTMEERFWTKVERIPEAGCWIWTGATACGYGYLMDADQKVRPAHRISFEMHAGPIPVGLDLDHLCRVRCCVNPAHLEPVTRVVNISRGLSMEATRASKAAITHCPNGHAYEGDNLYVHPRGARVCRACARDRMRNRRRATA